MAGRSVWHDRRLRKPKPTVSALPFIDNVDWTAFRRFLRDRCSERVVDDRVRYAQKFGYCLLNRDFSELNGFAESKRRHALESLSALAKFLGIYEEFKLLVKSYGMKWTTSNAVDLLISRMNKVSENGSVLDWIGQVRVRLPELDTFVDFVLSSGLRFEEAINSYNLIIDLNKSEKLGSYYNREKQILEHYRFKNIFIRRTKKAFISFIPEKLIEKISKQEKLTRATIDNRVKRAGINSRFSDIREYFSTHMTKNLNVSKIDFLQGRISANVFMRNYFNPALIVDLKDRVFKGLGENESNSQIFVEFVDAFVYKH